MSETFTFITSDNHFQFTIKSSFFNKYKSDVPVSDHNVYALMTIYNLASYLHNPAGPAIIDKQTGIMAYWLNGKQVSEEDGKKMAHTTNFFNDFNKMLKE